MLGIARNITERKNFEHNLQSLKDWLSSVIENVPGTTYHCSTEEAEVIQDMSDEIVNLTGYSSSYFTNQPLSQFQQFIHPDDLEMVQHGIEDSLLNKKNYVIEYRVIDKGGEIHWVFEKGRSGQNEEAETCFDAVIIDISERKANRK